MVGDTLGTLYMLTVSVSLYSAYLYQHRWNATY